MTTPPGAIVIGELSRANIVAMAIFTTLIAVGGGAVILEPMWTSNPLPEPGALFTALAALIFFGWMWLAALNMARKAIANDGVGLYVQEGVLHDVLTGRTVRLDSIRAAYREAPRGVFKTSLALETELGRPANRAYSPYAGYHQLSAGPFVYRTPISVMLERLQACGVKVKGSKTDLIGA